MYEIRKALQQKQKNSKGQYDFKRIDGRAEYRLAVFGLQEGQPTELNRLPEKANQKKKGKKRRDQIDNRFLSPRKAVIQDVDPHMGLFKKDESAPQGDQNT
jgi:hypothetical protein